MNRDGYFIAVLQIIYNALRRGLSGSGDDFIVFYIIGTAIRSSILIQ